MRSPQVPVFAMIALFVALAPTAMAQEAVENPHGEIDESCNTCHSAEGWVPARIDEDFDHGRFGFPLEHAHAALACTDCHQDLRFAGLDADCVACHADVHRGELGAECAQCHTTRSFIDVARQREMHRETRFALTGAHAGVDCERCHSRRGEGGLQFLGTSTECIDCHRSEYEGATDPDHVAGDLIDRCDACHSTSAWEGAIFNHERQFVGTALVCVNCHRDDYDTATDPPHVAGTFPLECQVCHDTRRWQGAFFQHDDRWFPIFSGRHAQEWNECSDCHEVSTDFTRFDCLGCHPHSDRAKTDADHREEAGDYSYDSYACYRCHPRGRGE